MRPQEAEEAETMEGSKKDEDWEYSICKGQVLKWIVGSIVYNTDKVLDGFI